MNFNPLDDLLALAFDPDADRSFFWNPLHPSAVFAALCSIVLILLLAVLARGG
jgi:hypothetical protein